MGSFLNRLKDTAQRLVDPNREQRINELAFRLHAELRAKRQSFGIQAALLALGVREADVVEVKETVLRTAYRAAWQDGEVSETERKWLDWYAESLVIPADRARVILGEVVVEALERQLVRVLEDGFVSQEEFEQLGRTSKWIGVPFPVAARRYFGSTTDGCLRGLFCRLAERRQLDEASWQKFRDTAARLGYSTVDLQQLVGAQVQQFVEHALADAKEDESLSADEDRRLTWMLQTFPLTDPYRRYVVGEVAALRTITEAALGKLPSLPPPPDMGIRAGEIVHFTAPTSYLVTKHLKKGPRTDRHEGTGVVTDDRFIFASSTHSLAIRHDKILKLRKVPGGFEVSAATKGSGLFLFAQHCRTAQAIWRAALACANQQLVQKLEGAPTRHIPRDVRQRVWQRYAGKCAECSSEQYLEFDHIIPVAKGGGNSDLNIQLLCRACNLKKSDFI